ncbi:MAG TPA: transcriptional regulator [Aigarchaeota archaeon]|nr:transcriptional regulator [Aigarchaeota archaeon]
MALSDKTIGIILMAASLIIIVAYAWLVFLPPGIEILGDRIDIFVLKLTGFMAIASFFGLLAWIGYTLATTPPPKPIEEIEKEIEEEMRKIEEEMRKAGKES